MCVVNPQPRPPRWVARGHLSHSNSRPYLFDPQLRQPERIAKRNCCHWISRACILLTPLWPPEWVATSNCFHPTLRAIPNNDHQNELPQISIFFNICRHMCFDPPQLRPPEWVAKRDCFHSNSRSYLFDPQLCLLAWVPRNRSCHSVRIRAHSFVDPRSWAPKWVTIQTRGPNQFDP